MPKRSDASLSVSDIGVDSILDAAGLGEDYDSNVAAGPAPVSGLGTDLGFEQDPKNEDSSRDVMDETEFARALGAGAPLIPDVPHEDPGLSGVDSGFFDPELSEDLWEVPSDREIQVRRSSNPNLLGQFGRHTDSSEQVTQRVSQAPTAPVPPVPDTAFQVNPRLSQLPHFELDLPHDSIDPADHTVFTSQDKHTGLPNDRAGIVQKKRGPKAQSPQEVTREASSTQRPVLIRPDDNLGAIAPVDAPKNSGQILARARLVSKVVRRRGSNAAKLPAARRSTPAETDVPNEFIDATGETGVLPDDEDERRDLRAATPQTSAVHDPPTSKLDEGADGVPDEIRVERPTGAAALVAWMSTLEEE